MCGIVGVVRNGAHSSFSLNEVVQAMTEPLAHRGPDDDGAWVDEDAGVALGFRRLAILDLSPTGHQPMMSPDDELVIVFNGEIYNHLELRRALEVTNRGIAFRGTSDTEILLAAIQTWGVEDAIRRSRGMFAFALWDRRARSLTLARDRLGEKPLYYGQLGTSFVFASELKALRRHPEWRGAIDRDAIVAFMRYQYIPAPQSIYAGIYKLPPGTMLTLPAGRSGAEATASYYWSLQDVTLGGAWQPFRGSWEEAVERTDALLRDAVRHQMLSDVPLGALLSGGVDSSAIVGAMQAEAGSTRIKTFTIGFHEHGYDEAHYARAVANHLGTDHTELYVTAQQAIDVIPRLSFIYDEPFADASAIPTVLVYELAKRSVTVALTGDGGDELFGGYSRYRHGANLARISHASPRAVRASVSQLLTSISPAMWDRGASALSLIAPILSRRQIGNMVHRVAALLTEPNPVAMYRRSVSDWTEPTSLVLAAISPEAIGAGWSDPSGWPDLRQWMMYTDLSTYLPDNILVKSDRASMSTSVESRSPFLDHHLVEFAASLPIEWKIKGSETKRILRNVLARYVPPVLTDRPKQGFVVPIGEWLRGPLRDWAEDLLSESRLRDENLIDPAAVRATWQEHVSSDRDWQRRLWNVLMFQAWFAEQRR